MNYEYTDPDGDRLEIEMRNSGLVMISVFPNSFPSESAQHVNFDPEDAPAVALAILEAAGIAPSIGSHPDTTPEEFESAAAFYLREAINKRSKQAEREAEDAKVREFMRAILPGSYQSDHSVSDGDRERYRAAREFFTRNEKPEPRVLNYGDPEPDRNTKWRDNYGDLVEYYDSGWKSTHPDGLVTDEGLQWPLLRSWFPMTEVTGDASR